MAGIENIARSLKGLKESEVLLEMEEAYKKIEEEQSLWYKTSKFYCPQGCGKCCHNFEPDLLECEALYMAAWLIENQNEVAQNIALGKFPFENGKTCPFHNFDNPYHCSIYGGRAFICRLFGASSSKAKDGQAVWKPCKFIPSETLKSYDKNLEHKQYSFEESKKILKAVPPVMSDLMQQALSFCPDENNTKLIREILPETVRKLFWLLKISGTQDSNPQAS